MNPAQSAKYWAEFGKLRDVLRAQGKSSSEIEEHRHALTRRALGVQKSSKHFTNGDLDKVLARIAAEREPSNLDAQLALQDSPEKRRRALLLRCHAACDRMWSHGNDSRMVSEVAQLGYIRGTARNVIKKELDDCTPEDLAKVLGCLIARCTRLEKEVAGQIATARAEAGLQPKISDDENPF